MRYSTCFLDRDGTINVKAPDGAYITAPSQLELLPGAGSAIRRLNEVGCRVIVVTNQRGVARGLMTDADVDRVHDRLHELLADQGAHLDEVLVCPHETGECGCRKPAPGLLLRAATDHGVDLTSAVIVGDSVTDVDAALAIGVPAIKLGPPDPRAWRSASDLAEAVACLEEPSTAAASASLEGLAVAYVVRDYPKVSHTFVQREVLALRSLGAEVDTYSLRRPSPDQVRSRRDVAEHATTASLLPAPPAHVASTLLRLSARHPRAVAATAAQAVRQAPSGIRGLVRAPAYLAQALLLYAALAPRRARHLHAHLANVGADVAWLATSFARRATAERWTWSFTMHGPTELHEQSRFNLAGKVAAADLVVCISDFCRSQLMAISDPEQWSKLVVVHCGVDVAEASAAADHHGAPTDELAGGSAGVPLHLLSIGRLVPEKAQALLIDALARLRDRGVDARLTLVGDGPDRDRLVRRTSALGLGAHVTFAGALGQDELTEVWLRADLFCLPSFDEGVPVVLMEAMARGLPVVTTRIAGIPELVTDGTDGVLVPPGRVDALVDAVEALAGDPRRRAALGAAGRATVAARFDARIEAGALGRHFVGVGADAEHAP